MTFNSGTTLDLSNASLLLPGNLSNVNIFSASFLEVDGNVQTQGFSVDRDHVTTLTDKTDVRLQWNENHADGTSTTKPARSWQFVGLDDAAASHTTDIVTFYNAKELITNNTESGINVEWDDASETFDFNVNDPTITLTGDITGAGTMTNLGSFSIATTRTAGSTSTADIADSAITQAKMADDSVGSAEMKTLSTLLIINSAGTTVKTLHGAGAYNNDIINRYIRHGSIFRYQYRPRE
jgi:hypothetical protein